jgi:transcriptional regulator with XRE-family HTH domain
MQVLTLEQWRIRKGMNQPQLSAKSGVDRSLISKLETGARKKCSPANMIALSGALEVEPGQVEEFIPMLEGKEDRLTGIKDQPVLIPGLVVTH